MIDKYRIPKYLEFLSKYKFPDSKSRHTAKMADLYYEFAYYQMLSLSETYTAFFKEQSPTHNEVMYHLHKSWAFAYAMYALLRTSLDAIRITRKMIGDTSTIDIYYEEQIKKIIDIANDIVKHPTFKPTPEESWAVEPQALSLNGEIDVVIGSDKGDMVKAELNPMSDFEVVRNYLEYIGDKLFP